MFTGFVSLAVGTAAAIHEPATGYELSLYTATPMAFWAGIGVALLAGLLVGWFGSTRLVRGVACVLGGSAVSAVVALPLLRGYYYYGHADAMTHLGWAKDLATGTSAPADLFYPGIHSFAVFVSSVTGFTVNRALLLVVFLFGVAFMVVLPIAARRLTDRDRFVTLTAYSAFLFLPINLLSTHLQAHAFTQTLLFSALALLLLFVYLPIEPSTKATRRHGVGALLALSTTAMVFYHPQQAVNMLLVFVAISGYQLFRRLRGHDQQSRTLYAQTVWFGTVFGAWSAVQYSTINRSVGNLLGGLVGYLTGNPPTAGSAVVSQSQSLVAIGSGPVVIFLKLFLVSTLFAALACVLVVAVLRNRTANDAPDRVVLLLTLGLVFVTPLPILYFLGDVAEHYFRHLGFIMLFVTLLGALALSEGDRWSRDSTSRFATVFSVGVPVAFAIMLVLSLVVVFPSPYIHKANRHVTESEMSGYETSLDHVPEGAAVASVRGKLHRYYDGVYGSEGTPNNRRSVSGENLTALPAYFEGEGYVVISTYERRREIGAYEELRYSRSEFRALAGQPGVDRVVANRETAMYHAG